MVNPNATPPALPDAAAVYAQRVAALQQQEARLERQHRHLGYVRLVFALAALVLLFPPVAFCLIPFAGFVVAARAHATVLNELAAVRRTLIVYARAQRRLEGRWSELTSPNPRIATDGSLFADDLDLFGPGSLFTLLCETRTSLGRDTLAQWLLQPVAPAVIRERQSAVAELRTNLSLREAFAAAPGPADGTLDRDALGDWLKAGQTEVPPWIQWLGPFLVLLMALTVWRYAVVHSPLLLVPVLAVEVALTFHYRKKLQPLFLQAEVTGRALRTLAHLAAVLEQGSFQSSFLQQQAVALVDGHRSASEALSQLQNLTQWTEARGNYLVRLLDAPLLYSLQLGLALERWRRHFGPRLLIWLDAVATVEALLSLGAYSFEHPGDPFPEIIETQGAHFEAAGLGHPLLVESACVRNDVVLDEMTQILLVSGSNMSGKSTLLRAIGVNSVLAFAGAPVRAHRLVLSPVTLAASIHVNDSLQAGRSRFYAEILRLRSITEAAHSSPPVLFLIDEVLAGTNSSDRLAGARGLLQALLRQRSIGLLSTHDLALTMLGAETPHVHNVHLEDEVVEGELRFDYILRDGPVVRSNGVALMRLIGLDV